MARLIIVEGADGSGKSTLVKRLAEDLGVDPKHFSRFPDLQKSVARMYVEAMMPALLNYEDVVFDRSWLSENPYAQVFWNGANRLPHWQIRMLERIALRCETTLINCDPGWDLVKANYTKRKADEMLENTNQLEAVYKIYKSQPSALWGMTYDYTNPKQPSGASALYGSLAHANRYTAGNRLAKTMIVTPEYPERNDQDSYLQFPMAQFSGAGNARWVTEHLSAAGVWEDQLYWCPATKLEHAMAEWGGGKVIAISVGAESRCRELGIRDVITLQHPTRFRIETPTAHYFQGVFE